MKSKLIIGGSIHPTMSKKRDLNNFMIERVTIKPKCISIHEAIGLALTSLFKDDPLSDLMGNLGFNVEQIKYSKKWKLNNDESQWLDMLTKMTTNYKMCHEKVTKKFNVKIQFKKRSSSSQSLPSSSSKSKSKLKSRSSFSSSSLMMPPPKTSLKSKFKNNNDNNNNHNNNKNHNRSTKNNYLHICAATQLDKVSPEEIRWKMYEKSIMIYSSQSKFNQYNNKNKTESVNLSLEIKKNLLLCSHWLYCQIPSEIQKQRSFAKKICDFTCWNKEKTCNVLTKIKFDKNKDQNWYHLVEIMYGHEMQKIALKFSGDDHHKDENEEEDDDDDDDNNNNDKRFDKLFVFMHNNWIEYDKTMETLKEDLCGSQTYDSSSHIVYDTTDRIYQDLINDRYKFYSKQDLDEFREVGTYQSISKNTFNKLSSIIETNLCSLYARDTVLSFLDEFCCFDINLKGLLPSIKFHQAFDNISDNENLVKFLELVFEQEKFARIMALERAMQNEIQHELNSFDTKIFFDKKKLFNHDINQNDYQCPIIIALMNTVLSRLLKYFDNIQNDNYNNNNNKKKKKNNKNNDDNNNNDDDEKTPLFEFKNGENINIEFVLWIVSMFVKILTADSKLNNNKNKLYKMLILIFNDTLMSLLFDCIVIAPTKIGVKVALMVSQIIEMYPKKHPLEKLKISLFDTIKLCDNVYYGRNNDNCGNNNNNEEELELCIKIKHIKVIGNVLQEIHSSCEIATDNTNVLIQLMLSITSCNYHHSYKLDLLSMSWFQSCYSLYNTLKWFSIKNIEKRNASNLQFLAPGFYSKLYKTIESWNEIIDKKKDIDDGNNNNIDKARHNASFIHVLKNNVDKYFFVLNTFKKLLSLPINKLCVENIFDKFKNNLILFCDIAVSLAVDKLPAIEDIIITTKKLSENKKKEKKPDWLILREIKQLCNKISLGFNLLYYTIFADKSNIIDKYISMLPPKLDIIMTQFVEKSMQEFDVKDISETFSFENCTMSSEDILWCQELKNIDNLSSNIRQQSIFYLNQLIIKNFLYIDVSNKINFGFGKLLCSLRYLILNCVSHNILQDSLENSCDGQANEPSFQVDRFRCKSSDEPDYLMFTECMKQLHSFKPDTFRLESYSKAWKCQFANEHATDAGGPYRESIEWMCREIETNKYLNLFMLCPNGINNIGLNRDKYIPSPNKSSYQHEKMYIFLGKLMGLAIRTKEILPLNIAPLIWKRICNNKITQNDIINIDQNAFSIFKYLDPFLNLLNEKKHCDIIQNYDLSLEMQEQQQQQQELKPKSNEIKELIAQIEIFNSLMVRTKSKFEGKSSNGSTYPLIPNGELIPITHKNVNHYKKAYINFRLKEYDFACNAIRRGLSTVIPINLLNILSWNKIEELICGKPLIDIKLFKQMTSYSNCSLNDKTIQIFWNVIKHKMNNSERSKLLQFVWGRSRLPINKNDFDKKMSILLTDHSNPNDFLPISHTCFFQLDLPKYTNADIMYQKLVYAITNCGSIDTDE